MTIYDETVKELLKYADKTPAVLNLLYDIDHMPEQLERDSKEWMRMLYIIVAFKLFEDSLVKNREI